MTDGTASPAPVISLGVGTLGSSRVASGVDLTRGRHHHVLRVALALRGGVSLAVWIGGAIAELDVCRRVRICRVDGGWDGFYIPPDPTAIPHLDAPEVTRAREYARALVASGNDRVEFDVIAGASAGGLNAVVYAAAQRAGASIDSLLETWREAADVTRLLQPPGFHRVDSLLRGDYYFWPRLVDVMKTLLDPAQTPQHPGHRSDRVSIDLAATLIGSVDRSVPGAADSRGHFHFLGSSDPREELAGSRIPGDDADVDALARLAYAARATSSYPGAFEPALVYSKTKQPGEGPAGDAHHVDMSFAFSGHRPDWDHPFRVIDGSILDDIPIDQAMRAARSSASATPSSRLLLYLDPRPAAPPPRTAKPSRYGASRARGGPGDARVRLDDRQSRILSVIDSGRHTLSAREPGADEIERVERFRLNILDAHARADAYASTGAAREYHRSRARRAYVRFRATADARLLNTVTSDPAAWQSGTRLSSRSVWPRWGQRERERLDRVSRPLYAESSRDTAESGQIIDAVTNGPQAALDAALCTLGWVRALEDNDLQDLDAASTVARRSSPSSLRETSYEIIGEATRCRDRHIARTLDAALPRRDKARWAFASWTAVSDEEDVLARLWRRLDDLVARLRRSSPEPEPGSGWAASPFSAAPRTEPTFDARDLAPFMAPRGIPELLSSLSFARITSDEPPARVREYTSLLVGRRRRRLDLAMSLDPRDVTDETVARLFSGARLDADDKLAGSLLWNFGGFLSRDWRSNDWWWGRMDAAAGLLRTLRSRSDRAAADGTEQAVDAAQNALLSELAHSPNPPLSGAPTEDHPEQVRQSMDLGADTLDNLTPRYRISVSSRAIRVFSRALAGTVAPPWHAALILLRPLAVLLPLVTAPARAAVFAGALGLAVAVVSAPGQTGSGSSPAGWPAVAAAGLVSVLSLLHIAGGARRWARLITQLPDARSTGERPLVSEARSMRRRGIRQGALWGILTIATAFAASLTAVTATSSSSTPWVLTSATVVTGLCAGHRVRHPGPPRRPARTAAGLVAYVLWILAAITGPGLLHAGGAPPWLLPALSSAAVGAITAALLTAGWLPLQASGRPVPVSAASTSLAAGCAAALPWSVLPIAGLPLSGATTILVVFLSVFFWGTLTWWMPEAARPLDESEPTGDTRHTV